MSDLIIQKAAFRKEPGTILKSPNSNMALALKRIVEKNPLDAMNLALILQKISNKKNLQISDLKKAAKNIGKNDRNLGKTLEGISTVAENAQSDEEYAGMTIGQIVGNIVGFLKNFIGSIVNFNDIWAKAIDTTFEVNINTAVAETSKMQWQAAAAIAGGIVTAIGGVAMLGGSVLEGGLTIEEFFATRGFEVLPEKFADLGGSAEGAEEMITSTTEASLVEEGQPPVGKEEKINTENKIMEKVDEVTEENQKKRNAEIKKLHGKRIYENKEKMEEEIAKRKSVRKGFKKFAKGLTMAGQPLGGGVGGATNGALQIPASNENMIAGKSRATGGVMESEKQRKSQLYSNTVKIFQGTSELSNTINAFIRANVPA